jgi:U11/U12 small nuclear ribonucleoprotein SNRNP35
MWYLKEYNPIQAGSIDGTDTEPHDAAIERASQSQCKNVYLFSHKSNTENFYTFLKDRPPHHFKSDPNCTLFVGRLSFDTVESALKKHFQEYGDIASVTIIRNQGN